MTVFGKGAYRVGSAEIPVQEIMFRAAADVLSEVTTGFDPERHLVVELGIVDHQGSGRGVSRYQPGSPRTWCRCAPAGWSPTTPTCCTATRRCRGWRRWCWGWRTSSTAPTSSGATRTPAGT
ncbi:hypothetical protein NKH77_43565 [Streptomyces sp. M19]